MWRRLLLALSVCSILVAISILYVDRPVATVIARFHLYENFFGNQLLYLPILTWLAVAAIVMSLAFVIILRRFLRPLIAAIEAGFAMVWAFWITDVILKPWFGRILPYEFLHGQQFGFYWFHQGFQFGSFPSGHAAQISALASVLWIRFPRWRSAYALTAISLMLLLVLGEWHFVSDVIAGSFIGAAIGVLTTRASDFALAKIWPMFHRDDVVVESDNETGPGA